MTCFRGLSIIGALVLLGSACDDPPAPPPPPPADSGTFDGGVADGAVVDGSLPPAGPAVRCVAPMAGSMVTAASGSDIDIYIFVENVAELADVTVNEMSYTPDALGFITARVTTTPGMNDVMVVATDVDGGVTSRLCSYLVSEEWHDPTATIDSAISMHLTPRAVDDGDSTDGLDSLNDVFATALAGGLISDLLETRFTTGGADIKTLSCDRVESATCIVETQIAYLSNSITGPYASSLTMIDGGLRFDGRFENIRFSTRVTGNERLNPLFGVADPLASDGTIDFDFIDVNIDIRIFTNDMDELEAEVARVNSVSLGMVTASYPMLDSTLLASPVSNSLRGLVETGVANHIMGPMGDGIRASISDFIAENLSDLLDALLSTISVRSLPPSFMVPTLAGASANLMFTSAYADVRANTTGLTFVMNTGYFGTTVVGREGSLGVILAPDMLGTTGARTGIGNLISARVINTVLHQEWQAGVLQGIVAPDEIVAPSMITGPDGILAPDMIVAPDTVQIDLSLPPVATPQTDGTIEVQLGGMNVSVPAMPGSPVYENGITARVSATLVGTVTMDGEDPTFGDVAVTNLVVTTDEVLDGPNRQTVNDLMTFMAWHVASFGLNEGGPALPLGSLETTSEFAAFGITAGTVLGTITPVVRGVDGNLAADGAFGEIVAPSM